MRNGLASKIIGIVVIVISMFYFSLSLSEELKLIIVEGGTLYVPAFMFSLLPYTFFWPAIGVLFIVLGFNLDRKENISKKLQEIEEKLNKISE